MTSPTESGPESAHGLEIAGGRVLDFSARLMEEQGWGDFDPRYLKRVRPQPPVLPLAEVLPARLAAWVREAAECKGAPADYVFLTLITTSASLIGNSRWAQPWSGWREPPVLWGVAIGNPSAGKSPGMDAVHAPLSALERELRKAKEPEVKAWKEACEVAKAREKAWRKTMTEAVAEGGTPPGMPADAEQPVKPLMPCLAVNDATVEKLAVLVAGQPRGLMVANDELSRWLMNMGRYANGGSDRPFWLEAYGGRKFTVERMSRETVYLPRLSLGVVGSIQPDRLHTLLVDADDDGLLARFLPVWPEPAPLKRPGIRFDAETPRALFRRLWLLPMCENAEGYPCPRYVPFAEAARTLLDGFRNRMRALEEETDGLMLSFLGKMPGVAIRLALVLSFMGYASGVEGVEPEAIGEDAFRRAALLAEQYFIPMARRAYADAPETGADKAARRLLRLLRQRGWQEFSTTQVLQAKHGGIDRADRLNPALAALEEAGLIRQQLLERGAKGGRPIRRYEVHPAVLEDAAA